MAINVKKKGNRGENDFAHFLKDSGFHAFRNSGSGNNVWKGDIGNALDLTIEVKTVKKINLQEAWRQVEKDASIAHNSPILAIHFDKMPKGEWLVVMHSEDFIALLQEKHGIKATSANSVVC